MAKLNFIPPETLLKAQSSVIVTKMRKSFKTDEAKKVFDEVRQQSINNQAVTKHPEARVIPKEQWETICFNFACYAAWAVDGTPLKKGTEIIDVNITNGKEVSRRLSK